MFSMHLQSIAEFNIKNADFRDTEKSALALSFGQNLSWTLAITVLIEICIFLLVRFASRVGNVFVFLLLIITLIP